MTRQPVGFRFLALVTAAVVLAAPSAAIAKKHKKQGVVKVVIATASASGTASSTYLEATATCPAGTHALGGGFDVPLAQNGNSFLSMTSARVGDTQWRAGGMPVGSSETLTTEVYCAKLRGTVSAVSVSGLIKQGAADFIANPACPAGTHLLSGGVSQPRLAPNGEAGTLYRSAPAGNGWSAAMVWSGPSGSPGVPVTAEAYCFKPAPRHHKGKKATAARKRKPRFQNPRPIVVFNASAQLTIGHFKTTAFSTIPCDGKLRAISGGFSAPKPSSTSYPSFNSAHLTGAGWAVSAQQFSDPGSPLPLTAYEDCA